MRNFQLICSTPASLVTEDHEQHWWAFSFIKYVLLWLLLWQDNMIQGSPIQLFEYIGDPHPLHTFEIWMIACFLVMGIERIVSGDYYLKRSYFWGPLFLMALALIISYIRGMWMLQEFRIIYEFHEAILTPVAFFIVINMFRKPSEARVLPVIMILAMVAKSFDGMLIYFFSKAEEKNWGVLQGWRDAFMIAVGMTTVPLIFHYKGTSLKWLKKFLLYTLPVQIFTLIVSYRRTSFLAFVVCLVLMFFTIPAGRKKQHALLIVSLLFSVVIFIFATDPVGFLTRLIGGVANPKDEGSAFVRLIELPNILLNIYHHPFFGVPVGIVWHQYYRMPMYAIYTLFGCHNTYLYWQLRAGILGSAAFWWFLGRQWKAALIQFRLASQTEEKYFFAQFNIMVLVVYQISCFFGLLYGDGFIIMAVLMAQLQLMMEAEFGVKSLRDVRFFPTMRSKRLVFRDEPDPVPRSDVALSNT